MKWILCIVWWLVAIGLHTPVMAKQSDSFILINLATNQLAYFQDGQYIRAFPISTGKKATPTPEGEFLIINKYRNKDYHRKDIKGGAPNNPLGTRWMGLNYKEYAIHGTNKAYSIGRYESNGCIRMNNRNIEWLYERIPLQTKVRIATFHEQAELAAHRLGYRVTSWNGQAVREEQVGRLRTIDRITLYWRDPNGQLQPIRTAMPNEQYPVISHNGSGTYYIGNNFYIVDAAYEDVRYEQVPYHIIVNQYKRSKGVL